MRQPVARCTFSLCFFPKNLREVVAAHKEVVFSCPVQAPRNQAQGFDGVQLRNRGGVHEDQRILLAGNLCLTNAIVSGLMHQGHDLSRDPVAAGMALGATHAHDDFPEHVAMGVTGFLDHE